MGEAERGDTAPRQRIVFFCANGHETATVFAVEAAMPDVDGCLVGGASLQVDEFAGICRYLDLQLGYSS